MRTKMLLLAVSFMLLNSILIASEEVEYVITENDTFIGASLDFGLSNAKITKADGEKIKIDKDEVESYLEHGRRFDKMPVYMNGKNTGKESFLELLSQRNGLKLYKFKCNLNSKVENKNACMLLVFKEKDFYVQVDKANAKTIAEFFHIKEIVCN